MAEYGQPPQRALGRFGSWFFGRKPAQQERRAAKRFGIHEMVTLKWAQQSGEPVELQAQLIDFSEDGLAVRVDQDLEVGRPVEVFGLDGQAEALVRHSRPDDAAFIVGLETLPRGTAG